MRLYYEGKYLHSHFPALPILLTIFILYLTFSFAFLIGKLAGSMEAMRKSLVL